ncbi:MAG: HD domain-containing protein [Prevotella sp.]|nr:HD domain-containing protein [Prevotellaceae bacterium]MDY5006224.1 HD domain-containing protein [Prevotella sp.]
MDNCKIINDPVFGFIKIPKGLLMDIVNHPLMQRLTRINQLGLASVVYPSARHTRFQHSIGAYHLMSGAILSLQQKGCFIFDSEAEAAGAAILMHDIGHAPFSHVLEHTLISGISHEEISMMMMEVINRDLGGQLTLAIKLFKDDYPKHFLHQLISSQLDMDRLDYLRRDCFFTGVTEGNIGSDRIIKMLNVANDELVVEHKGLFSIENYLTSRRLMYWQVYLHKTAVASERILVSALLRAKHLCAMGQNVFASPALAYFLKNNVNAQWFATHNECLEMYSQLDDSDIWCALKVWAQHDDKILATLAQCMIERKVWKTEVIDTPPAADHIDRLRASLADALGINICDTHYFYDVVTIEKDMYDIGNDSITIIYKDGTKMDLSEASDLLNIELLSKKIRKYYLCYHRF